MLKTKDSLNAVGQMLVLHGSIKQMIVIRTFTYPGQHYFLFSVTVDVQYYIFYILFIIDFFALSLTLKNITLKYYLFLLVRYVSVFCFFGEGGLAFCSLLVSLWSLS